MRLPVIPMPYLCAGVFLIGLSVGGYGVHTWYQADRVKAIEQARRTETVLQQGATVADTGYLKKLTQQLDKSQRNADRWRALYEENKELANCVVGPAAIGVLNDAGMSGAPASAARAGPAAAETETSRSNCAAELDVCRRNYTDVCVPNEVQLGDLQRFTRKLIADYNKATGKN